MRVKIKDTIYDSNEDSMLLILNDLDKANISSMSEEATKYCCFPGGAPIEDIKDFMKIEKNGK
jgi:hypothetical protein